MNGANASANFSSTVQTYAISGTISGAGGANATVKLTGAATATVTASTTGAIYLPRGSANGSYTVTDPEHDRIFNSRLLIKMSGEWRHASAHFRFSAIQTYTISGTISGASGAECNRKIDQSCHRHGYSDCCGGGVYPSTGVTNGFYAVTPSKTGHLFSPASQNVTVSGANVYRRISPLPKTYSISGTLSGGGSSERNRKTDRTNYSNRHIQLNGNSIRSRAY